MTVADRIRARLQSAGVTPHGNANIAPWLEPDDLAQLEADALPHVEALLHSLVIDTATDHNTQDTAARVARMLVREVFAGRYQPAPCMTSFPNVREVDECYAVGPIALRSCCAHHLVPITGSAWIGVIPGERLIGLSKFHRTVEWVMARPQIQEEAAEQVADAIDEAVHPRGLAVVIRASHLCCSWRGVRDSHSLMTTAVLRGLFKHDGKARAEFFSTIAAMGFA